MMYKHSEDTLKKAKNELQNSVVFGFSALFSVFVAIAAVIYTVYTAITSSDAGEIALFISIDAALAALIYFLLREFRKHFALERELDEAAEEESGFFKINCLRTSAVYAIGMARFSGENGKVQGFYLTAEGGEEYFFALAPSLELSSYAESAPDLLGTLYIRKYKGTNLLCEIRKSI